MFWESRAGQYLNETKVFGPVIHQWLPASKNLDVKRLNGGSFNRIIGITIPESYKVSSQIEREFILRIRRFEDARPDREVATLNFIQTHSSVPIAKVVAKSYSCDNPLRKPFVIQRRIPGKDLHMTWTNFSHQQKCTAARELAKTLLALQSLMNPMPGIIDADTEASGSDQSPLIIPYDLKNGQGVVAEADSQRTYPTKETTTLDVFLYQMNRWRSAALEEAGGDEDCYDVRLWTSLMDVAKDMARLGLFKADKRNMSLCHLDLQPRNIMAEIHADGSLHISGYLDWDSAVFAPGFVGCAPPRWLWADEDDESTANDEPSSPEKREVKRIFEEAVGTEYLHYAYAPQYPLARSLFRIAKNGVWSNEHLTDVDRFMDEWDQPRGSLESEASAG